MTQGDGELTYRDLQQADGRLRREAPSGLWRELRPLLKELQRRRDGDAGLPRGKAPTVERGGDAGG